MKPMTAWLCASVKATGGHMGHLAFSDLPTQATLFRITYNALLVCVD